MAKISDLNSYDFEFIDSIWEKGGWKGLFNFCRERGFYREKSTYDGDKNKTYLVCESIDEIFNEITEDNLDVKDFIATALKAKKKSGERAKFCAESINVLWGKDIGILEKILDVLSSSKTIEDAINCIGSKKIYEEVTLNCKKIQNIPIEKTWHNGFAWLLKAIKDEVSEEEAWWNCAWIFIKNDMNKLLQLRKQAMLNHPISKEDIALLNDYYWEGHPILRNIKDEKGKFNFEICLDVNVRWINLYDLHRVTIFILAQPAFLLAQFLMEQYQTPKYEKICRSPHCRATFLTARGNATSCPGSRGNKKSKCALEWIRYKRWLEKTGRNPEENWQDQKLQEEFLSND
jgi:hypothetical protein